MAEEQYITNWYSSCEWDRIKPLDFLQICERIHLRTSEIMGFWKDAYGWAPKDPANLLNRSMLEWQISLAECLSRWVDASSPGELILAWANLGCLVEGQMKLLLCVYYHAYEEDAEAVVCKGKLRDPDGLQMEHLRQFFQKRIWETGADWNQWILHIQERRNAIHAFKRRRIGTFDEWRKDVRKFLLFLEDMDGSLPYP